MRSGFRTAIASFNSSKVPKGREAPAEAQSQRIRMNRNAAEILALSICVIDAALAVQSFQNCFNPISDCSFGLYADHSINFSTILEKDQCRNALNAEAGRRPRIFIRIQLGDERPPREVRSHLLYGRRKRMTGATPWGPKIDKNGKIRPFYNLRECGIAYSNRTIVANHERRPAISTLRLKPFLQFFNINSVDLAARGAARHRGVSHHTNYIESRPRNWQS